MGKVMMIDDGQLLGSYNVPLSLHMPKRGVGPSRLSLSFLALHLMLLKTLEAI